MRKALLSGAVAVGWVTWATAPAGATLHLYEPFNHAVTGSTSPSKGLSGTDGAANNAGGYVAPNGQTWNTTSTAFAGNAAGTYTTANDAVVVADNLSYAGLATSSGNAISYGGNGFSPRVAIDATYRATPSDTGTTIFYSFLFKISDISGIAAAGGMIGALNNSVGSQTGNPSVAPAGVFARPVDGGGFQVGIGKTSTSGAAAVYGTEVHDVGETLFVVGSYTLVSDLGPGVGLNDTSTLYVNPTSFGGTANGAYVLTNSSGNDTPFTGNQVASFFFRQDGGNATTAVPAVVIADELRVGDTFAEVTPAVPEPASLAAVGLAAAGLLSRRRRRA